MASERAEIISTFLSREKTCSTCFNEEKETRIFNFLTYPEVFKFEKVKGKIKVQHNGSQFDLLKTSEGIIEAKVASLLLARKDIKTLCLEDPDRGMHPQMIERLKTVLYNSACDKTIIVVTHSPYFIDSLVIHKTHKTQNVFFRNKLHADEPYVCSVLNVGENSDLSRVGDIETLRILLFATKVLLVKGVTDKEVVQTLLTKEKCIELEKSGITENNKERNRDSFIENKYTHQIIPIGGCDNVDKVQAFCDYINLPCLCLLDRNKVIKRENGDTKFWGKRKDIVTIRKLEKSCGIQGLENFGNFGDYMEALQSKLKETTSPRKYTCIQEIINFRQKEKRDEDKKNYIEGLEKKLCPEDFLELRGKPFQEYLQYFRSKTGHNEQESERVNLRKIANFWEKRYKENDFNTYMDELIKQYGRTSPSFWENKKEEFEEYLKKLQSNRKTFVWRSGKLEDAILSSEETNLKIYEILYSTEQETVPIQRAVNVNESKKTGSGQSSKNDDVIAKPNTRTENKEENRRQMTKKKLEDKLKERLDDYTRQELCECWMEIEEIKQFLSFIAEEGEKPEKLQTIYPTPDDLDSRHAGLCLNCFS